MKFGYTILYVDNIEKTIAFYERAFGLKRNFVHESGYGELHTGETKLAFAEFALASTHGFSFQKSSAVPFGFEIALVTDAVEPAFKKAVAAGATALAPPEKKPWGQTVSYVKDINGYIVELCSPIG